MANLGSVFETNTWQLGAELHDAQIEGIWQWISADRLIHGSKLFLELSNKFRWKGTDRPTLACLLHTYIQTSLSLLLTI